MIRYVSGNKLEKNEMGGACSAYGERRSVYMVVVGKNKVKRPLGRPRPDFHMNVRVLLNRVLQQRWIGLAAKGDNHLLPWPPRSPDLTPCDFFLWGFVKDIVYVPPLPMSLKELRDRITHTLQTITADMLHRVWDEFDYRVDVCRVTQGAHTEGL